MAYDVFISYSHKERPVAEKLYTMIKNAGISCWMDSHNLVHGSHWPASIAQAVRNARLLVLLFSKHASSSPDVAREVALAGSHRLVILPIKIDETRPNHVMEYYLSICHWLELGKRKIEEAEGEIVDSAQRHLRMRNGLIPPEEALLDIYDRKMDQIGVAKRGGVHREGLWHKTMHCWFVSMHDGKPCVWFQQRSEQKQEFPTLFDITAGRHLLSEETDRDSVEKICQEVGVAVSFAEVLYIGVRKHAEKIGRFHNREFNSVYVYECGKQLERAVPNPDEVSGVLRLDAVPALRLFSRSGRSRIKVPATVFANRKKQERTVGLADFVPRSDDYYVRICRLAIDFCSGAEQLSLKKSSPQRRQRLPR